MYSCLRVARRASLSQNCDIQYFTLVLLLQYHLLGLCLPGYCLCPTTTGKHQVSYDKCIALCYNYNGGGDTLSLERTIDSKQTEDKALDMMALQK